MTVVFYTITYGIFDDYSISFGNIKSTFCLQLHPIQGQVQKG